MRRQRRVEGQKSSSRNNGENAIPAQDQLRSGS
jgi:hypothetical protein